MAEKETQSNQAADLCRKAEDIARINVGQSLEDLLTMSHGTYGDTLPQDLPITTQDLPTMATMLHELLEQMVVETEARERLQAILQMDNDTVLLVDDEPGVLSALTRALRNTGYQVLTSGSAGEALSIMETTKIKVIVSDEQMVGMKGSELLAEVQKRFPHTIRILLTGHATLEAATRAVNVGGIYRFLTKPWDDGVLRLALSAAVEKYNMEDKNLILQDAFRQSEERYRTVVEQSPQAVVVQRELKIIYANPAASRIFGATSLKDLAGSSILDRIHPGDHQATLERVQKVACEGVSVPMAERRYRKFDGTIIDCEVQGTPILYDGLPAIHTAIQDITERKQAEEYGEMRQEILSILNEPQDSPDAIQRILAVLKARTGCSAVAIRLQNGDDFPYLAQDGFAADFLRTENTLVSHGADGLVCRDKEGNVQLECTCGLVIAGHYDPSNPFFTRGGSFWTNDSSPLLDLPSNQDPRHHPRKQCQYHYASLALVPLRSKERIVGLIQLNDRCKGHFTSETINHLERIAAHIGAALVRKWAEEALLEAHDLLEQRVEERTKQLHESLSHAEELAFQAEAASRAKSLFMGNMSHELRTPLSGVLGMTEALLNTPVTEKQRDYAETIRKSGKALLAVVSNILDFSKISAGNMALESSPFFVEAVIANVVNLFGPPAAEEKIGLNATIDPELPAVRGDAHRLTQVVSNLVGNAVKFTKRGEIQVAVKIMRRTETEVDLEIGVQDTGIGMTEEELSRIFTPFTQGDTTTGRRFGGTGLGLTISRNLAELMGGTIQVESVLGRGSLFTILVTFPIAQDFARPDLKSLPINSQSAPLNHVTPPRQERPPGDMAELQTLLEKLKEPLDDGEPMPCKEILAALREKSWPEEQETLLADLNRLVKLYRLQEALDLLNKDKSI
ncbi:MAG: ATP-binding protein [Syntrophales bacterium]